LHEVEEEREVQRPKSALPADPEVSIALRDFLRNGTFPEKPWDFHPAFEILKQTRLWFDYVPAEWSRDLLVTRDFMNTIKMANSSTANSSTHDDFLRPVEYVLKIAPVREPIIISPHEAQSFVPLIRRSASATLVLYQARTGKQMAPFDDMKVYQIPESSGRIEISPTTITTLNLFAGQLYFTTFEDYERLCTLIGLWDGERPLPINRQVAVDNFVSPACREDNSWTPVCHFRTSPVKMLKEFIGMRRLGQEWRHTHLGRVLHGRILHRDEFKDGQEHIEEKENGKDVEEKENGKDTEGDSLTDRCELS
jgi:hypothetical protein